MSTKKHLTHDTEMNDDVELIDGELINASVTKIQNALEEDENDDGAISLEEFLDFMGVNGADEDNSGATSTIMLPIAMMKNIDHLCCCGR